MISGREPLNRSLVCVSVVMAPMNGTIFFFFAKSFVRFRFLTVHAVAKFPNRSTQWRIHDGESATANPRCQARAIPPPIREGEMSGNGGNEIAFSREEAELFRRGNSAIKGQFRIQRPKSLRYLQIAFKLRDPSLSHCKFVRLLQHKKTLKLMKYAIIFADNYILFCTFGDNARKYFTAWIHLIHV